MKAIIQIVGADLLCRSLGTSALECRIDGATDTATLLAWAARYDKATRLGDQAGLFAIGREMFDWLNPSDWAAAWAKAAGPRELEIRVDDPAEPLARAVLEAPWELLARETGYLADDAVQLFELSRRIGAAGSTAEPKSGDLQLMFMAAAPAGENPLGFEAEESAILEATKRLPLHLVVEESGCAQFLGERLDLDGPFEALHLSCHGDIHPRQGPVLALEDETGQLALTGVGQLVATLGDPERMPLVFLSACRTAEQIEAGERAAEPFVRELVRAGVANVLGWDGSVYDTDAQTYAHCFYKELASLQRVPRAAAVARQALCKRQIDDPRQGRHWHLARLYLGPAGGGALAARGRPKRKPAGGGDQFLDPARKEVPVAGRAEFVGRRRAIQAVLKAYRDGATGVLIHGMGNLGKSSLAFRVSTRLTRYEKVVVFGKYDALSVFDRVAAALPPLERMPAIAAWRDALVGDPPRLADALEALLEGPLDAQPILLVVDDLERILETPRQSDAFTPVQASYRAVLAAILLAFQRAQSESRLLITSRYRFSLPDGGGADLAQALACVPLQPMDETEREKQLRAAARLAQREDFAGVDTALLQRALDVAEGNPGLQAVLSRPILAGETTVAGDALAAIEHFRRTGVPPDHIQALIAQGVAADKSNAMVAFFKRMAFDTYRAALSPAQAEMLRACCLFAPGLPIPRPAVEAAGQAAGVADAPAALDRLLGLGLVDDWGIENGVAQLAANPLARPLGAGQATDTTACLADAALPELDRHWRDAEGRYPRDIRAVEAARLALVAESPSPGLLNDAAEAAARFRYDAGHDARHAFAEILAPALGRLDVLGAQASPGFLLIMADCAGRVGEAAAQDDALDRLGRVAGTGEDAAGAQLYLARRHARRGEMDLAADSYGEAAQRFRGAGQIREWAIARGGLADIHQARGDLDEALRIRREDQLPVYERLGDVRGRAVTLSKIADIYKARGEIDEALRIYREEALPVFERLGDVRARAVTLGKIGDVYQARGELDEALALHGERLPIYERLGDIAGLAHIRCSRAAIRLQRGDHEHGGIQEIFEDLSVAFDLSRKLQRPDFIASACWLLAQVLAKGGLKDEALHVLDEAEAAWRKLGNAQGLAQVAALREAIRA